MKEKKFWILFWGITALRLIVACTAPLADDEAYHWTWTTHLDFSYFDHPGMVAWLEFLTTLIFGPSKIGLRLPAFLCHLGGCFLLYSLAFQMFGLIAAQVAVFLLLFTPLWGLGGFVAAPEPPFVFLWCLGLWVFWQSVRPGKFRWSLPRSWFSLGVIMGLGLNTKFPIVLLALGMGLYLLTSREGRGVLKTPWPWLGALLATALAFPVWIWNIQNGWPSFVYQFYRRHQDEGGLSLQRWFEFFALQNVFMTPVIYFFLVLVFIWGIRRFNETRFRFIVLMSAPTLLIFYIQPLKAAFKPHWPAPAYLILALGVGWLWQQGVFWIRPRSRWVIAGVLLFVVPLNLVGYVPLYHPILTQIAAAQGKDVSHPDWDYSHEFFGWEQLGARLRERLSEIQSQAGVRPRLASYRYELVGRVWYAAQEETFSLSHDMNQYQIWQTPQVMESLKGQTFLFVTTNKYNDNPQDLNRFDSCKKEELPIHRGEFYARSFYIWTCQNFQGIR